jgi:L-threonylcarbamoyladenylate synthase
MNTIIDAISALREGELIVYPTDTLYGLGADIFNDTAIKKVFEIKHRPFNEPLPIAVSSYEEIEELAFVDEKVLYIAKKFLPGPLTIVLKKKNIVSDLVTAGYNNVAIRIPNNKVALQIISQFGPITATSANIHNMPVPSTVSEIKKLFQDDVKIYIEYGKLQSRPSTIIDLSGKKPRILREGAINSEKILEVINRL